jgi:hypothetical protein
VKILNDQELCKVRSTPEEVNTFEVVNEKLLFCDRSLKEIGQAHEENDLEISLLAEYKTIQVTEGEKIFQSYDTTIGDEDISANGHGYKCVKSRNSQEVHFREGIRRVSIFASMFIKEDNLEAVANARLKSCKLVERFQRERSLLEKPNASGEFFVVLL